MHVYLATKQYITELKEERKEFKSPKCKVILTRFYTNLKNQLQRQCPIDENECLFKTSNLTVKTDVIYRYIFWRNSTFSNTFKCVLEHNASSFMDALTRLWKQCNSEIIVYPLSYVFTVILGFLLVLHHIMAWLKCNIIVVYVKQIILTLNHATKIS